MNGKRRNIRRKKICKDKRRNKRDKNWKSTNPRLRNTLIRKVISICKIRKIFIIIRRLKRD